MVHNCGPPNIASPPAGYGSVRLSRLATGHPVLKPMGVGTKLRLRQGLLT